MAACTTDDLGELQPSSAVARLLGTMLRASLLCLLLPFPLAAQNSADTAAPAAAPKPSGVTISVPLLVREKKGAPVANPSKDDLMLSEDSQPQTILTLGPASGEPLTFGILVDTSNGQRGNTAEEKAASQAFVEAMMQAAAKGKATTQGFVAHFDRDVELLTDLTASQDKLERGVSLLDTAAPASVTPVDDPAPGRQTLLYDALFLASDEITSKQSGRKALILFSGGIDRGSKESLRTVIDTAQRSGTTIYAVYVKSEETKGGNNRGQRRDPSDRRDDSNYPGGGYPGGRYPGGGYPGGRYPGGGYPGSGYPGDEDPNDPRLPRGQPLPQKFDGKRILADIVTPTGGRVFELNKKQSAAAIYSMIEDDLAHQTVVTFMPDKAGVRPGFHSLRVASKSGSVVVEARDGFYIPEPN